MSFTCPECGKTLQAKSDLAPGKRIKCPKCATVFVPVEKVEEVEEVDEEQLDENEEQPRRKRARDRAEDDDDDSDENERRRPRKKKARARQGMSPALLWGLIGGGALVLVGAIVVVVILLAGGGGARGQHEAAAKEMVQIINDLVSAVESVKDPDSARAAAVKVHQSLDRMEALANRIKALPKITQAEEAELKAKLDPQMIPLQQRMQKASFQAGRNARAEPSLGAALQRAARLKI